jgi:twitching motility two-component system response regulator PilH
VATILMIDDDRDLVAVTKLVLEAHGHVFHSAPNGDEGLRRARELHPDVIVLDVMMDRYTEGFYVSQQLRSTEEDAPYASCRQIPILVLTSIHRTTPHRFGPDENALPVDALLEKPASPEQLLEAIDALLAGPASSSPHA